MPAFIHQTNRQGLIAIEGMQIKFLQLLVGRIVHVALDTAPLLVQFIQIGSKLSRLRCRVRQQALNTSAHIVDSPGCIEPRANTETNIFRRHRLRRSTSRLE